MSFPIFTDGEKWRRKKSGPRVTRLALSAALHPP
jgi:hypothetical protein